MTSVPIDEYLAGAGEHLEDLTQLVPESRYRFTGTVLTRSDLDAFENARSAVARPSRALVAAGLVDERGSLTPQGQRIHRTATAPAGRVLAESRRVSAVATFEARFLDRRASVVLTGRPGPLDDRNQQLTGPRPPADEHVTRLDWMDAAQVPAAMAAWIGLGPAWSLATRPTTITEDAVLARCSDPSAPPPPDADAHLRYVWSQPWTPWTLRGSGTPHGRSMVSTGRTGQFEMSSAEGGHVVFQARPSSVVWTEIVDVVARASSRG